MSTEAIDNTKIMFVTDESMNEPNSHEFCKKIRFCSVCFD